MKYVSYLELVAHNQHFQIMARNDALASGHTVINIVI